MWIVWWLLIAGGLFLFAWGVTRFMDVAGVKAGDDNKTIDEYKRAQKALRAKGKPRWYDAGNWDGE